jgi:hypothetical protein
MLRIFHEIMCILQGAPWVINYSLNAIRTAIYND